MFRIGFLSAIFFVAGTSPSAAANRCEDFESVIGTFGDVLPKENFDLTTSRIDEDMLRVVFVFDSEVDAGVFGGVFLRLTGTGENPTVIPVSYKVDSAGSITGEYWILNSDFVRSGLMVRYAYWRNEDDRKCLAKRRTYFVPMPANNALD